MTIQYLRAFLKLVWMGCFFLSAACSSRGESTEGDRDPIAGARPLKGGQMQISETDRCPVCGMVPAKTPKFASAIQLKSGRTYYFCGTGCMIRTWLKPKAFLNVPRAQLSSAVTRDYFAGKNVDALGVIWVVGSDVMGPMGRAIVPLANRVDLKAFKSRHGGRAEFKLGDLTAPRFEQLTGKRAGRH